MNKFVVCYDQVQNVSFVCFAFITCVSDSLLARLDGVDHYFVSTWESHLDWPINGANNKGWGNSSNESRFITANKKGDWQIPKFVTKICMHVFRGFDMWGVARAGIWGCLASIRWQVLTCRQKYRGSKLPIPVGDGLTKRIGIQKVRDIKIKNNKNIPFNKKKPSSK